MKCLFLSMLILATPALAEESQHSTHTNILIRLTEISVQYPESGEMLVASFVPISITRPNAFQFGGGALPKGKWSDTVETKIGKEFSIRLSERPPIKGGSSSHRQTIYNALKSCAGTNAPRALKLDLIVSVPADTPTDFERHCSEWMVKSIEIHSYSRHVQETHCAIEPARSFGGFQVCDRAPHSRRANTNR
jgi:hypothetical protein